MESVSALHSLQRCIKGPLQYPSFTSCRGRARLQPCRKCRQIKRTARLKHAAVKMVHARSTWKSGPSGPRKSFRISDGFSRCSNDLSRRRVFPQPERRALPGFIEPLQFFPHCSAAEARKSDECKFSAACLVVSAGCNQRNEWIAGTAWICSLKLPGSIIVV